MLEARKENKVYTINVQQKYRYLKEGFDIYENGIVVEHTPKKVIKYSDHLLLLNKAAADKDKVINDLKEKIETLKADTVLDLLKQYAEDKSIDIGTCTSAKGILDKILEVEKE